MTALLRPAAAARASLIFRGLNIWELLRLRARATGSGIAFVWQPFHGAAKTWTYADLQRDSASLAAGLARRGIRAGDKVLIHLENCPEFVLAWYACAAVGAVAVATNTRASDDELSYYVAHSEPSGIITQPRFHERMQRCAPHVQWIVSTDHDGGVGAEALVEPDSALASLFDDPDRLIPAPIDPLAPMCVQYTSGTTARPKAVLWTHANALWGARINAAHEGLRPDDCFLCYLPLFHTNALAYTMLASLWVGSRFVLVPKWSTSRFWELSVSHRCTWVNLILLSFRAIETLPRPKHHCFRFFGAGVCDLEWDAPLGIKSIGWWGMTETITTPIIGDLYTPNRPGSMGRPAPEYGVAIVRPDGQPVEPDETGDLLIFGTPGLSLFAEYLHDEAATAASFDDRGWFRTGDRATLHADGHLSFAGRAKDMLKVGGENVAAVEIESATMTAPRIREAAVVACADPVLDEVPVAFVIVAGDADGVEAEVVAACRERLADFKVPRAVYAVRALPRSTLGKVNKAELRAVAGPDADRCAAEAVWAAAAGSDPSGEHMDAANEKGPVR